MSKSIKIGPGFYLHERPNGIYQVRVTNPETGKRHGRSLRTDSQLKAVTDAKALYQRFLLGEWSPWGAAREGVPLKEAWRLYARAKRSSNRPKTIRDYRGVLDVLMQDAGLTWKDPITSITRDDVYALLSRDLSDRTRETYYAKLRAFFSWCVEHGHAPSSPVDGVKRPPKPDPVPDGLTRDQFDRLVSAVIDLQDARYVSGRHDNPEWLIGFFRFVAAFGLRPGEAASVKWSDVRDDGFLFVRATKTRSERMVTITPSGQDVLDRLALTSRCDYVATNYTGRGKVAHAYASKKFREAKHAAGIDPKFRLYSLRHTYAREYRIRGGALHMMGGEMGHRDLRTTLKYGNVYPDARGEYTRSIFGDHNPSKQPRNGDPEL